MFHGRVQELNFLESKYESKKAEMVILYGKRRIGKTKLLSKFSENKDVIFFSCVETNNKMLLKRFFKIISDFENRNTERNISNSINTTYGSFDDAILQILKIPFNNNNSKKILILDEFQYLALSNKTIMSSFKNLWNSSISKENILIIFCSSSIRFVEKEIINDTTSSIYECITDTYKMEELSFYESIEFFPKYSQIDKILTFSIFGGIPYYLEKINENLSLEDNIKDLILTYGNQLYEEVINLLHYEFSNLTNYQSVLSAISNGANRLVAISNNSLIESPTTTNKYITDLIEFGFVEKEFSIDSILSLKDSKSTALYKVASNYFKFYYKFILPNNDLLERGLVDYVYDIKIKNELREYSASMFKTICIEFLKKERDKKRLPIIFDRIGSLYNKTKTIDSEIDIVATNDNVNSIIIGKCNFKNGEAFNYNEYLDLVTNFKNINLNIFTDVYYTLFSATGFDKKLVELSKLDNRLILYGIRDILSF